MGIFEQYGIKEVADVCIYSIHKKQDNSGDVYYVPALYLDTLKVSSVEKTAENVWAQGGLGNSRLVCWDYGKQINLTLEDALCTPASLGLCWGGVLGADWKDGKLEQKLGITWNRDKVERLERMEKAFYPRNDKETSSISYLLPQTEEDRETTKTDGIISTSQIVDGTNISGFGMVKNHSYKLTLCVESDIRRIATVPNKFFDIYGKSYVIDDTAQVIVNSNPITITGGVNIKTHKFHIIYKLNKSTSNIITTYQTLIHDKATSGEQSQDSINKGNLSNSDTVDYKEIKIDFDNNIQEESIEPENAEFLAIVIDNDDNYHAYLAKTASTTITDSSAGLTTTTETTYTWHNSSIPINTEQFKGLDLCIRFDNLNELIYFILTKYSDNINYIEPVKFTKDKGNGMVTMNTTDDTDEYKGKLWAYINPRTMQPYPDDYWFHQGEPYYIKSLTLAPKKKELKAKRITVPAGQFPGMYMIVGETYIRNRDTGEDERLQIKFPLCKIKSNQTLTLQAEGDPTTFNLEVEVARPVSGIMMEMTSYEVDKKVHLNEDGELEIKDGSTEVLRS